MKRPDVANGHPLSHDTRRQTDREARNSAGAGMSGASDRAAGPMPEPLSERARARLESAAAFVEFLRGGWGAVAGISVLFPLFNGVFGAIPMAPAAGGGAFHQFPAGLVTALAFLAAISALTLAFARRQRVLEAARKAWISLGAAGLCFITYLILHGVKLRVFDIWGVAGGHPFHLAMEAPMMVLYVLGFASMTRAFALFGLAGKVRAYPSDGAAPGDGPEKDDQDGKEAPQ